MTLQIKHGKVLKNTAHKTIIRHGELKRVLTSEELEQWNNIVEKIREYDKEKLNVQIL